MMMPIRGLLPVMAGLMAMLIASPAVAEKKGKFIGKLVTEALDNGRDLKLIKNFSYRDSKGKKWSVPKGTIVDGASIPQAAWAIIGGPFSGKYRRASIIHDYYCVKKNRPWKAVHRMFYDAMVASGVEGWRRSIMYLAVYRFGPRWEKGTRSIKICEKKQEGKCIKWKAIIKEELILSQPEFDKKQFEEMQALLKAKDLSPDEIEKLADKNLRDKALDEIE